MATEKKTDKAEKVLKVDKAENKVSDKIVEVKLHSEMVIKEIMVQKNIDRATAIDILQNPS